MGVVTDFTDKFQPCIDACSKCGQGCYQSFYLCLKEENVKEKTNCLAALIECANYCFAVIASLSLNSLFYKELCAVCSNAADRCAYECGKFKEDHLVNSTVLCKNCADECRRVHDMLL
jgi:hypothetical protein